MLTLLYFNFVFGCITFLFFLISANFVNQDIFENIDKYNEFIKDLRKRNCNKIADFFDYIMGEAFNGNEIPVYLFLFLIMNIPILNLFLFIDRIKLIYKK